MTYRRLTRSEVHPAGYLPGMDPDDPIDVLRAQRRRERRRNRHDWLMVGFGIAASMLVGAGALIAAAAGWE